MEGPGYMGIQGGTGGYSGYRKVDTEWIHITWGVQDTWRYRGYRECSEYRKVYTEHGYILD